MFAFASCRVYTCVFLLFSFNAEKYYFSNLASWGAFVQLGYLRAWFTLFTVLPD
jgi:hypothetical protein